MLEACNGEPSLHDFFRNKKSKKISAYTKDNVFVKSFDSTVSAAEWCFENGKTKSLNSGVRSHISETANGKRKSAYGYKWKYLEN